MYTLKPDCIVAIPPTGCSIDHTVHAGFGGIFATELDDWRPKTVLYLDAVVAIGLHSCMHNANWSLYVCMCFLACAFVTRTTYMQWHHTLHTIIVKMGFALYRSWFLDSGLPVAMLVHYYLIAKYTTSKRLCTEMPTLKHCAWDSSSQALKRNLKHLFSTRFCNSGAFSVIFSCPNKCYNIILIGEDTRTTPIN